MLENSLFVFRLVYEMLFEVFQPHVRLGFDVLVEHILIHDLDSVMVSGKSSFFSFDYIFSKIFLCTSYILFFF